MTTAEAKEMIGRELMDSFIEWLRDYDEMPDSEFGQKYGWGKGNAKPKMNFEGLKEFMDLIFGADGYAVEYKKSYYINAELRVYDNAGTYSKTDSKEITIN